jgi:hypothetical protein
MGQTNEFVLESDLQYIDFGGKQISELVGNLLWKGIQASAVIGRDERRWRA